MLSAEGCNDMSLKDVTKETAYSAIKKLTERFSENYESYKNQSYNETQTRIDFINPFFKALGWDMDNEKGFAEAYREVIHEDRVKVGEAVKAPDYCFTIQGQKKLFYIEAKKDGKGQDDLIKLVDIAISLNKDFYNAKTTSEKQQLQDRIDHTDKKIDELIYKLYSLTDEEIKIIEAKI